MKTVRLVYIFFSVQLDTQLFYRDDMTELSECHWDTTATARMSTMQSEGFVCVFE